MCSNLKHRGKQITQNLGRKNYVPYVTMRFKVLGEFFEIPLTYLGGGESIAEMKSIKEVL